MSPLRATVLFLALSALILGGWDNRSKAGQEAPKQQAPKRGASESSEFWKVPADFGELYIPAQADGKPTPDANAGEHSPGSYDPRKLMPLAVGNRWTYRWKSPAVIGDAEVKGDSIKAPLFIHSEFYIHGERMKIMNVSSGKARNHEETYTIVRQDGDHFFFDISSNPPVEQDRLRDGRYNDSVENAWTWTDNKSSQTRSLVLTESIKRKSVIGFANMFRDSPEAKALDAEKTILEDHRMVLFVPFFEGKWGYSKHPSSYQVGSFSIVYNSVPKTIQVPAGTFQGCLETVEHSPEKVADSAGSKMSRYRTHTFWAPGTGIVREYQEFADGKIAFERELVKFVQAVNSTNR